MDFDTSRPWKLMLKMCIPSVITILIMQIYHMADVFFIGKLGSPAMVSGLSLASPVIAILSTVGVLVGGGGCAALAMALGRKDDSSAKKIVSFSFWSSIGLGVIVGAVLLLTLDSIVYVFGASEEAKGYCRQYMLIMAVGAPAMCFSQAMGSLIRGKGKSMESLTGNMIGSVLNIVLDPLFIFVFRMGVLGAAAATLASNLVASAYYIALMLKPKFGIPVSIRNFTLKKDISVTILSLGLPMAFMTVLNFVSSIISNRILASYGDVMVASVSITHKITSFVTMLQMGITSGMQPVLAYTFGACDYEKLRDFTKRTAVTTVVIGSILTVSCYLAGPVLVGFFMDIPEIISIGTMSMKIVLLAGPFSGLQQLGTSFFQATKKPSTALFLSLTRDGIIYIPFLFLFNGLWGFTGYLYARPVGTILSVIITMIMLVRLFPDKEKLES